MYIKRSTFVTMCVHLLFLNDVGGSEVFLILVIVLMFFGSKSIPGIARSLGKGMRQIRDAQDEVQREIRAGAKEVQKGFDAQNERGNAIESLTKPFEEVGQTMSETLTIDQQFDPPHKFSKPFGNQPLKPIDNLNEDIPPVS